MRIGRSQQNESKSSFLLSTLIAPIIGLISCCVYFFGCTDMFTVAILNKHVQMPKEFLQCFVAQAYSGKVTKAVKKNPSCFEASEKRSTWG